MIWILRMTVCYTEILNCPFQIQCVALNSRDIDNEELDGM